MSFLSTMLEEMGARRRRARGLFGPRGSAIVEFLVFGGLVVGSLGLFLGDWMPRIAPWGFAMPFVFVAGFVLIELRRQRAMTRAAGEEEASESATARADWAVFLWAFGCAIAGAAAFVIAWGAKPPPPTEDWHPPPSAVDSDIGNP